MKILGGTLCISLDTEYFWGVHDTTTAETYGGNVRQARKEAIPGMLRLFEKYGIHATWAMVGAAFAQSYEELEAALPTKSLRPTYKDESRNPFDLLNAIKEEAENISIFLAGDDIDRIRSVPGQAIGTHTFSHYYCCEEGQTTEQFSADMEAALRIAKRHDVTLKSIVFPKMQYTEAYLSEAAASGIAVFRGIEDNWIYRWKLPLLLRRGLRLLDAYFPLSGHNCHKPKMESGMLNVCGSRILKPYSKLLSLLEPLKICRIKSQMRYAAKHDMVFHLWWHPHNFGAFTEKNLTSLEKILKYYRSLQEQYGMKSRNMEELYDEFQLAK